MPSLYLDCFAGISGNMFLGVLLDLGLPEDVLRQALAKLPISKYELQVRQVKKQGIKATFVDVRLGREHHHRHLPDIEKIIDAADLAIPVKKLSKQVFRRLAEAEAKVHGTTVEKIHFHEVGAVDAIIDIVGTVFGLDYLGIEQMYLSKLTTGTGFVNCQHGRMPIPAPATAELLQGLVWQNGDIPFELVTPTGAALVTTLSFGQGQPVGFVSQSIGYGAGSWDLEIPNVVRGMLGEAKPLVTPGQLIIETNIDDQNPQFYAYVMAKLFAAGARDVWMTAIMMKKNRPGSLLSVLVDADKLAAMLAILFAETSAIGLRYYPVERVVADRVLVPVNTTWGSVQVKVSSYLGQVSNICPEYEDCRSLAEKAAVPLKIVWQQALTAAAHLYPLPEERKR